MIIHLFCEEYNSLKVYHLKCPTSDGQDWDPFALVQHIKALAHHHPYDLP